MKRVVITGMGVVSSVGNGLEAFWGALLKGESGVSKITAFDASDFPTQIAAQVDDFDPSQFMHKKQVRRMDRVIQFAVAGSQMALTDAQLDLEQLEMKRVGCCIGTGIGGMDTWETQHNILIEKGPKKISPFFIPMMIPNMPSGQVSIQYGFRGPNFGAVSACATGAHSIMSGVDQIRLGRADLMLCGGSEAAVTPLSIGGFCALRAMSTRNDEPQKASRPFDRERDGFVLGEGCGVLVLEELEHAKARGAKIYAEVAGCGSTADANHITNPREDGAGAIHAIEMALEEAQIQASQLSYINAHGTSTPIGDICESEALQKILGDDHTKVPVSSTKSMTGHTLGAAGALETIVCALSVHEDKVPPTINYEFPDPKCALDVVPNVARKHTVDYALNNSFGFGGQNCVLLLKKYRSS